MVVARHVVSSQAFLTVLGTPVRRNHPSPSSSPPVKITHRGFIEVHDAGNNNLLGYVSKNLGNGGAQFVYDPSITNALNVTFDTDGTGSGTRLDINAIVCTNTTSV